MYSVQEFLQGVNLETKPFSRLSYPDFEQRMGVLLEEGVTLLDSPRVSPSLRDACFRANVTNSSGWYVGHNGHSEGVRHSGLLLLVDLESQPFECALAWANDYAFGVSFTYEDGRCSIKLERPVLKLYQESFVSRMRAIWEVTRHRDIPYLN